MTAFNAVRFQVKPGRDEEFIEAHKKADPNWKGLRHVNLIQTGEHSYCIIGEWDTMEDLVAARPAMGAVLESFRDTLTGPTDPVSGQVVLAMK